MKDFYFVEKDPDVKQFDWELMPLFAPQTSLELVRANLMKLCSASLKMERKIQVFRTGALLSEITIFNGRIVRENQIVDRRTDAERDLDFFYEKKSRRAPSIARSAVSNDWFLNGHVDEVPNQSFRRKMRVKPEKRNTRKAPGGV